jgi:hypothetical protein
MTNEIVLLIESVIILLGNAGVFYLLKSQFTSSRAQSRFEAQVQTSVLQKDITIEGAQIREGVKQQVISAVTHLDKQAGLLMEQSERLRAHAQLALDSGLATSSAPRVERTVCNQCRRLVYKFERMGSGTFCYDCLGKNQLQEV